MDFLRRHVFLMGCSLACVAGIALGFTGWQAMPNVREKMKGVGDLYSQLNGLQLQPVNQARIQSEQERIDRLVSDRDAVIERAKSLYPNAVEMTPDGEKSVIRPRSLVENLFPEAGAEDRFQFRTAYKSAMENLLESLKSGAPPTPKEVSAFQDKIENERATAQRGGLDPGATPPPAAPAQPLKSPAGVLTPDGARVDAQARASIANAQRTTCYAVSFKQEKLPNKAASLHFDDRMKVVEAAEAPEEDGVWFAQLGYWIQQDVVEAIVAVNDEAAAEARKNNVKPWVGMMPVKDVLSIRVAPEYASDIVEGNPLAEAGGTGEAFPAGTPDAVFSGSGSGGSFETIQYTLKLIMDQRDIPNLVDRICRNSFHTLLRVAYVAVPPNREMREKIYGSEPTVNVVMDFEFVMLGKVFREFIPSLVCEDFSIPCPQRNEEEEDDG